MGTVLELGQVIGGPKNISTLASSIESYLGSTRSILGALAHRLCHCDCSRSREVGLMQKTESARLLAVLRRAYRALEKWPINVRSIASGGMSVLQVTM
jgi:hypothetical protein